MGTTRLRANSGIVKRVLRIAGEEARERRFLQRAARRMPKPVPWDWAAPRLLPILSGPAFDRPGESLIRARSELGPMVGFGLDLGTVFTYVDVAVAQRWECTADQLMARGLQNLGERASRIPIEQIATGVMSGRAIRILQDRPTWASSIVLVPDELFRLFGDHDQILGVPTVSCLVSLPIDTPAPSVADILVGLESEALRPLWLDPFVVSDRRVTWSDDLEIEDDDGS